MFLPRKIRQLLIGRKPVPSPVTVTRQAAPVNFDELIGMDAHAFHPKTLDGLLDDLLRSRARSDDADQRTTYGGGIQQ